MRKLTFTVPPQYDGKKAQGFLRGYCNLSYRTLVKLKRVDGGITRNGELLRTIDILHTSDVVVISMPETRPPAEPKELPLDIVFEDDDILICNKPANMPVHPSRGHADDTLANAVASYLTKKGEKLAFRPVNRLDRDTTGIVVCAKNAHCAANLCNKTEKIYIAVCEGNLVGSGTIDLPIGVKEGHGIMREVNENGEHAVTHYKVIGNASNHTLLEIKLETGRTHQIRVHFSHIGHPLAGDDMYGGSREFISRQALHCKSIHFMHPICSEEMDFDTDLPSDMVYLCKKLHIL